MLSVTLDERLWLVEGDRAGDTIVIEADPVRPSRIRAVINGVAVDSVNVREIDTVYVKGGDGNDRILVNLRDGFAGLRVRIDGELGNDTLLGGAGRDELRGGRGNDLLDGGAGADVLRGERGNDDLAGDDGNDQLSGDAGADTLAGGWGRDIASGGADADQLRGGADGDWLYGNDGPDTLAGGEGRDRLLGGGDRDRLYRESSRDQLVGNASEMRDAGDDAGAVIRVSSRDEWARQIIDAGLRLYRGQFGQRGGMYYYDGFRGDGGAQGGSWSIVNTRNGAVRLSAADANTFAANNVTGEADQSFSRTNTQVDGVDEADTVETNGRYIYSLRENELVITDVGNARALRLASKTSLGDGGSPLGMYLEGSRLTVISNVFENDGAAIEPVPGGIRFGDYWGGKARVQVTTFDVSDPAAPTTIAKTRIDGSYQSSRLIDRRLAIVVNNGMTVGYPQSVQDGDEWRTETEAEFAARVRREVRAFSLDVDVTKAGRTTQSELIDVGDVYLPSRPDADVAQLTTVAVIDTGNPSAGPVSSATYAGSGGTTYASRDALYVVNPVWTGGGETSNVVKFGLDGTNVAVEATGTFEGRINDQFSLDEHGRHLRVAYTRGFGAESTNGLVVFDQIGDALTSVGELKDVARGESIFSARFIGDEAYLVTFERTDPLFTINLSDPAKPTLVGELVIPGFSTYLHPLDANHLIGIGRAADENGVAQELQLSLFDVTDRANPRRLDTISLSAQEWNGSEAEWNHLAFQYNARAGVILLPVYDGAGEGTRVELIRVDASDGFERIGSVSAGQSFNVRGLWIGGTVFAVGEQSIHAADIDTAASYDDVALT